MSTTSIPPLPVSVVTRAHSFASRSLSGKPSKHTPVNRTDTPLLHAIRNTLRAARAAQDTTVHSSIYAPHKDQAAEEGEELLAWDTYTVTLSQGDILRKKWSFQDPIQWACIGVLIQPSQLYSSTPSTPAYYREDPAEKLPELDAEGPHTFGPYARARMEKKREETPDVRVRGVFVFLRGSAKIYLMNGLEYTLNLPFIVRRAWPVEPCGLFIQRVVESWELEESKQSGSEPLTTIFTLTSPFAEPSVIGVTDNIRGGMDARPPKMKPNYAVDPVSLPPDERILWVSPEAALSHLA